METKHALSLEESFAEIQDPRIDPTKLHKLIDILIIAVCAVICILGHSVILVTLNATQNSL